jgi:dephospho-CoA kinase
MVIGVTGKYCAGKNTVAGILKGYGFAEIDVDAVGHEVLEQETRAVTAEFGPSIIGPEGRIDRRRLGAVVFSRKRHMRRLENILHPPMKARIRRLVGAHKNKCVINAALLFTMDLHRLCDFVIMVKARFFTRLLRAVHRDHLGFRQALQRFLAQGQIFTKLTQPGVDIYYVYNNGSERGLTARIAGLVEQRNRPKG